MFYKIKNVVINFLPDRKKINIIKNDLIIFFSNRKNLNIVILIFVVTIIPSCFFYYKYKTAISFFKNQPIKKETKQLINRVDKLMELPQDELPTVATVTDKNKLKNQPIFARAENGDKLLIYPKAKKAILYRPSTNKIIEVVPISTGTKDETQVAGANSQISDKIKVAIYNGTKIAQLTTLTEKQLNEKMPQLEIVKKTSAQKNYSDTLVVDLKGRFGNLTQELAQFVSGKVSSLPVGEINPEADILIILGQ